MAHKNAEQGKRWERWCATFLDRKRRGRIGDHFDIGDLDDAAFVYECKYDRSRSPMQWWQQADAARIRGGRAWAIVLAKTAALTGQAKRPGEPEGWATQSIEQWRIMRDYIEWLEGEYDLVYNGAGPANRARVLRVLREGPRAGMADSPLPFPLRSQPNGPGESSQGPVLVSG